MRASAERASDGHELLPPQAHDRRRDRGREIRRRPHPIASPAAAMAAVRIAMGAAGRLGHDGVDDAEAHAGPAR